MKVYKGNSPAEMKKELDGEKGSGNNLFSAILNQADRSGTVAKTVPFASATDFNIHQLEQAEAVVFDRLQDFDGKIRVSDAPQFRACGRAEGFLSSVAELIDDAPEGRMPPEALCYIYNGQLFQLTLAHVSPVERKTVRLSLVGTFQPYVRDYRDLLLGRFENFNETIRQGSSFELLLGTSDTLGGPVQISYQPNSWFEVVLNLKTPEGSGYCQSERGAYPVCQQTDHIETRIDPKRCPFGPDLRDWPFDSVISEHQNAIDPAATLGQVRMFARSVPGS
jgi:hypothetical protein